MRSIMVISAAHVKFHFDVTKYEVNSRTKNHDGLPMNECGNVCFDDWCSIWAKQVYLLSNYPSKNWSIHWIDQNVNHY